MVSELFIVNNSVARGEDGCCPFKIVFDEGLYVVFDVDLYVHFALL